MSELTEQRKTRIGERLCYFVNRRGEKYAVWESALPGYLVFVAESDGSTYGVKFSHLTPKLREAIQGRKDYEHPNAALNLALKNLPPE